MKKETNLSGQRTCWEKDYEEESWKYHDQWTQIKDFIKKNGVCQILHSWEAEHPSRFDNHELDTETHIGQRPDYGKDVPKRKPKVHQIPRHWNRSQRTNGKMAIKKIIATTVTSREIGLKRREEKTMSSQRQTATQGNQQTNRNTSEGGGRDKLKNVDGDFPARMRLKKGRLERKRRRTTQTLQCWWRCAAVLEKNWRKKKSKDGSSNNNTNNEEKATCWAEAKICAAIRQVREMSKKTQ